mgnify:CR=1 FL=1
MAEPGAPASAPAVDVYADHAAINTAITDDMEQWSKGREPFLRAAKRNLLFYRGHQWIRYDRVQGRFRPLTVRPNTPQPVTNFFSSTMDAVASVFARIEPKLNFRPATNDPEDRATADVATRGITVVEDEVSIRVHRQSLAAWVALTGGAWLETGYDPDPIHGLRLVPHEECLGCGQTQPYGPAQACAACQGQLLIPAVGPDGQPIGAEMPIGKMYTEVVSIFEMFFDAAQPQWSKQRRYCRRKSVTLDQAKARWTDLADVLQADTMEDGELSGADLATLGPSLDDGTPLRGLGLLSPSQQQNDRVTEEWYSRLPDEQYPEGLLAIRVNKVHIAHAGPLPYHRTGADGRSTPFLNTVWFPQKLVPGTAWPKTVGDDLAPLQVRHNQIESMVMKILMTTSNPVWLKPNGIDVSGLTGVPAQIISYNALGPSPAKPERISGQNLPAGLMHMQERLEAAFEEVASVYEILKGNRPEGVSAGIALQILQERALSKFGPLFILWETAWAEWASQALEIYREYATEERLVRLQGRNGTWEVSKFLGADLAGRVDVIAEAGSSMPRSTLLDRAEVEQLVQMGIVDRRDPEVQQEILKLYGRSNLTPGMALDTKNAIMENEAFESLAPAVQAFTPEQNDAVAQVLQTVPPEQVSKALAGVGLTTPRVRAAVDHHGIHLREILLWLKSEAGQRAPDLVKLLAEQHASEHRRYYAEQNTPHPPVKISLSGQLDPQTAMDLSGDQPGPAGGSVGGGSGLLAQPPAGITMTQPLNTGAGGKRMVGDMREMMGQGVGS